MKLHAFSIFDKGAASYLPVFFVRARGEAIRHFQDAVNDGKSPMFNHPQDFELYSMFTFEDGDGLVTQLEGQPERVVSALECRAERSS